MNFARKRKSLRLTFGFTLVETAIALGIVATGLLTIVAMAGTTFERVATLADQNAALRLRSTLQEAFQNPLRFPSIYAAIRQQEPVYAYCYGADSGGEGASRSTAFELASEHINGVRLSTEEQFASEVGASAFVFRVQFEFFDVASGEEIQPEDLPEDPSNLDPLLLPAVVRLFMVPSDRVAEGDHSFAGRPVTTFNAVLKP